MSSRVNYALGTDVRQRVSNEKAKEDLQEQSQAFMNAALSLTGLPSTRWRNKSHLKVTVELARSASGTSAVSSVLKQSGVRFTWPSIDCGVEESSFRCVLACGGLPASEKIERLSEKMWTRKREIIRCVISKGRNDRNRPALIGMPKAEAQPPPRLYLFLLTYLWCSNRHHSISLIPNR